MNYVVKTDFHLMKSKRQGQDVHSARKKASKNIIMELEP